MLIFERVKKFLQIYYLSKICSDIRVPVKLKFLTYHHPPTRGLFPPKLSFPHSPYSLDHQHLLAFGVRSSSTFNVFKPWKGVRFPALGPFSRSRMRIYTVAELAV